MTTFALIHGAGSASNWRLLTPILTAAGHDVVAPQLPMADPGADFVRYADVVDAQLDEPADLVVVGLSMGAFTAPVLAARHPGSRIVLVAPMIPTPGEVIGGWSERVGLEQAQQEAAEKGGYDPAFDLHTTFLHDLSPAVVAHLLAEPEPRVAAEIFGKACPIEAWPDAPTRVIAGTLDRMFPFRLVRRLARTRLGVEAEPIESGHLVPLRQPEQLARLLTQDQLVGQPTSQASSSGPASAKSVK